MKFTMKIFMLSMLMMLSCLASATDVVFAWSAPTQRMDSSALLTTDLGGYEIHYQKTTDTTYKTVVINDGKALAFTFSDLDSVSTYTIQIAAFDKAGLYSTYASSTYKASATPKAPSGLKATQKVYDVVAACLAAAPNCRVAVAGEWQ